MGSGRQNGRFPWVVVTLGAIAVVGGLVALLRVPEETVPLDPPPAAKVELARPGDDVAERTLQEEVALLDPRPLFLPTELNAGQAGALADDGRREPSASFQDFPAQLTYAEDDPMVEFPATIETPANPVAALRTEQGHDALSGFGRQEVTLTPLPARLAYFEVIRAETGHLVLEGSLPPDEAAPQADWTPVELVAAVGPAGLIGLPVLTESSGSAPIDAWAPGYLAKTYRLGERLAPGFYRVRLGP